jgi:serine/threonine-protein kinase RsbT
MKAGVQAAIMSLTKCEILPMRTSDDIVHARQAVRVRMVELAFNLVAQTKMVTATSELGRNTVLYGGGGTARLESLVDGGRNGPGIANIEQALTNGFTTGQGLGLGLGGSKRLVHDFEIFSRPGEGTRVSITMWK